MAGWEPVHSPGLNVFGFFGQFVDAKGIDVALRAAALTARETGQEIELKVFGGNKEYATADYLEKIEAVLDGAPETLTVTEVGSYSRDNVFDLMATVDWVVTPSIWPETFSFATREALATGLPVLTLKLGAQAEAAEAAPNGYVLKSGPENVTKIIGEIDVVFDGHETPRAIPVPDLLRIA